MSTPGITPTSILQLLQAALPWMSSLAGRLRSDKVYPDCGELTHQEDPEWLKKDLLPMFVADGNTAAELLRDAFSLLETVGFTDTWSAWPARAPLSGYATVTAYLEGITLLNRLAARRIVVAQERHHEALVRQRRATGATTVEIRSIREAQKKQRREMAEKELYPFHLHLATYREHIMHSPAVGAMGWHLLGAPSLNGDGGALDIERLTTPIRTLEALADDYRKELQRWANGPDGSDRRFILWLRTGKLRNRETDIEPLHWDRLMDPDQVNMQFLVAAAWWVAALNHDIGNLAEPCLRFHTTLHEMNPLLPWRTPVRRNCHWQPLRDFVGKPFGNTFCRDGHLSLLADADARHMTTRRHVLLGVHHVLERAIRSAEETRARTGVKTSAEWVLVLALALRAIVHHEGKFYHTGDKHIGPRLVDKDGLCGLLFLVDRILLLCKGHYREGRRKTKLSASSFRIEALCSSMGVNWDSATKVLQVAYGGMKKKDLAKHGKDMRELTQKDGFNPLGVKRIEVLAG